MDEKNILQKQVNRSSQRNEEMWQKQLVLFYKILPSVSIVISLVLISIGISNTLNPGASYLSWMTSSPLHPNINKCYAGQEKLCDMAFCGVLPGPSLLVSYWYYVPNTFNHEKASEFLHLMHCSFTLCIFGQISLEGVFILHTQWKYVPHNKLCV
jgi:hypothetical protein